MPRRLLKVAGWLMVSLLTLLVAAVIAMLLYLKPPGGPVQMDEHHPFRSAEARAAFLSVYDRLAADWPEDADTRMLPTGHGETLVRSTGPKDAPPLILLHGGRANSLQWLPNIEGLARHFRVHAVDTIGDFGRSLYSRRIEQAEDYVFWLEDLVTELELDSGFNLLGVSYGGWIAAQYAAHAPQQIDHLILVAAPGTGSTLRLPRSPRAINCLVPVRSTARRCLRWMFSDVAESGPRGQALIDDWSEMFAVAFRSFKGAPLVFPAPLAPARLERLTMPVLFVVGEEEILFDPDSVARALQQRLPHVQVHKIPEAGHGVTAARPAAFNQAVIDFLASAPP